MFLIHGAEVLDFLCCGLPKVTHTKIIHSLPLNDGSFEILVAAHLCALHLIELQHVLLGERLVRL